jgi:NAD-dependent dihydropyrimidine dehydrogenase PreA subunit
MTVRFMLPVLLLCLQSFFDQVLAQVTIVSFGASRLATPSAPNGFAEQQPGGEITGTSASIYYIWYGFNSDLLQYDTTKSVVETFSKIVGSSSWYQNLVYEFTTSTSQPATTLQHNPGKMSITPAQYGQTSDYLGTQLNADLVQQIVTDAIQGGALEDNPTNGIYVVMGGYNVYATENIQESFVTSCVEFCSWHGFYGQNNTMYRVAFVTNPQLCLSLCAPPMNIYKSPNANPSADATVNLVANTVVGAVLNPLGVGWVDQNGEEASDICMWQFGNLPKSGSYYWNVAIKTKRYLLQQMYRPTTDQCSVK